ncbi:NCAM-related cell adhesion molecule [Elysia marginata]|uniref:NCAM-related cell adhesion molecule n=1 Tax=Elysia marginata TaxID=1093978 RepID=A0AAV4FYN5_9GAST|nr:NCAM-related cell adhesion molecule [Elysia marginata]
MIACTHVIDLWVMLPSWCYSISLSQDGPAPQDGQQSLPFSIKIDGPAIVTAKTGDDAAFSCESTTTDAGEAPKLAWFVNDQEITDSNTENKPYIVDLSETRYNLIFSELTEADSSTVECKGTLNGQVASATAQLQVVAKLEVTSSKDQYGFLGQDGTIECQATVTSAKTWYFENGTKVQHGARYIKDQDNLIIKDLTFDDAMTYKCQAFSPPSQVAFLQINYAVVERPKIETPPTIQPNNPKVGDEVKITCTATGTPKPVFQFKRGDNPISGNENEIVDGVNGILTLKSITSDSEGSYICIASNTGGTDEKSVTLDVKIPPTIRPIGPIPKASEDESRDIKCTAEGDPAPSLIWQRVGGDTITSTDGGEGPIVVDEASTEPDDAKIKVASKILRFSAVRPSDAGEYMCKAINNAGTVNVTIDFEVLYAPHFETDYKEKEFYGWRGHRANLTCMASANELANFKWYIPSEASPEDVTQAQQISNEAPYTIETVQKFPEYHLSSSSLLISLSGDDDTLYRDYICEADNGQTAVRTVTLKKAKAVERDSVTFHIKQLEPSTSYVIEIQAVNIVDKSPFRQITFQTQEVSEPGQLVITSSKDGSDSTSYTLRWAKPEDNGSPITKYTINWQKVTVTDEANPGGWILKNYDGTKKTEVVEDNLDKFEFKITGLESSSFYHVEISATNGVGDSIPALKIIKTTAGAGGEQTEVDKEEPQEPNADGQEKASTNPASNVRDSSPGQLACNLATLLLLLATSCLATLVRSC